MPESFGSLLKMAWRNGAASAYARRHFPEALLYNPDGHVSEFQAKRGLLGRVLRNAGCVLGDTLSGRWYGSLYGLAYATGNLLRSVR
jgi:hypothetical protein